MMLLWIFNSVYFLCFYLCHAKVIHSYEKCDPNKLTVYRINLQTAWSPKLFPKQYPEWRPPAQWSKLIGIYNNDNNR